MDYWTGDIVLRDDSSLKEITFSTSHSTTITPIPSSSLRFLSVVETSRIPLYLAAGPSFDVWTTSTDTEEWFSSILAGEDAFDATASGDEACAWWTSARAQSAIGILVEVEKGWQLDGCAKITDILFYGTLAGSANAGLPTPPASSQEQHSVLSGAPELRVHALPLSSDLLVHRKSDVSRLSPPIDAEMGEGDGQFLSPLLPPSPGPEKRKKVNDMFDKATERRRKARQKGGEAVAAAASKIELPRPASAYRKSLSIDSKAAITVETLRGNNTSQVSQAAGRPLSRSPSFSSDIRPLSRKGLLDGPSKRSTLSRVTSISAAPEEQTTESRNKEALSRVVMAGMRMHGLQQRKKTNKSRRSSVAPSADGNDGHADEVAAEEAVKDEEYKLIYHQTFKGAALALRKHMATQPLHSQPDSLRDVVDRLLAIFCTDPLAELVPTAEPVDPLSTPGNRRALLGVDSAKSHKSPFESIKHSGISSNGGEGGVVNSPSVRKGNREVG
ncbi:uncharacterized protein BDZ99DRAFT_414186 [Mytilinidion resinicola]|uniref:Sld7 C-terminal domain-containing protein n=1 Tax=Mytilinidion resinicola TaxID=574789 RepID=A0A6A6YT39_9PEZI|nr:uncharacterized protein BDZ99DRAFT_414186 [Mytilinidion resinicola]KAF2811689.1 hypothetical protein BDZ99DRAFT_414186 [Mytilinidion resinicola]